MDNALDFNTFGLIRVLSKLTGLSMDETLGFLITKDIEQQHKGILLRDTSRDITELSQKSSVLYQQLLNSLE